MRKHAKRRAFTPRLAVLEQRRLLALTATWIGQDGSDFVGTEGLINPQRPNDYQDIHIHLTGLSSVAVASVTVTKPVSGGWVWNPLGNWSNAVYKPAAAPGAGDLYMEPEAADPAGTLYDAIRVVYADGTFETTSMTTGSAVDPNLRTPGEQVTAVFVGQVAQDWTGPNIGVGPDGIEDVQIALSNLSAGAAVHVTLTAATNPPRVWESGTNPDGHWNAELLNRPGQNGTLGTTADLFISPDVNLAGVPMTLVVTYEHQNPDGTYTNRSGKTDTVVFTAGATNPNLAMPAVALSNLPQARAASLPQDASSPGYSHAALDAGSLAALPSGQSFATVRTAVLSNLYGSSWAYTGPGAAAPYTGGSSPMALRYNATTGVFDFPPVRDEAGSTLTLLLTFNDGSQAVARFAGAPSDIGRLVADTRVGASVLDVASAADLLAKLQAHAPNIHLTAGSYTLNAPLNLNYPVQITADPGITLNFALSSAPGSPWNSSSGAILVSSSHVALDGFAIRFQGDSSMWTAADRAIVQAGLGDSNVDLSFTHLDVQAPSAAIATGYEDAFALMNFDPGDSGLIANNILKGGWIQLGVGPWQVLDNDYQGAVANTITPTFLNVHTSHDLTITGNHVHALAPAGITLRFLVYGGGDSGQGIGNLIENNTIDGGIGTPVNAVLPPGYDNSPEIILLETYQPRFEGKPSAVSPDGSIVQIPALRGPSARTGDVVSIVTGPYAGQWRMIAQALSPTRYLLADPLPQGDYVITIGRGFVDQTYRGNTIDVRGMSPDNVGLVISGNDWGTRIVDNTFLGGDGLRIGAGSSESAFEGQYGAPWGWSRLPVFDLAINGNMFDDAYISLSVAHDRQYNKSSSGRTYLTGDFSNNEILWTDPSRSPVTIGVGPDPSTGAPAYTQVNYPWLTLDEIRLTMRNNWRSDPSTGAVAATIRVYAATLNGVGANDQTYLLPTASIITAASLGQDGSDFVGGSGTPTSPDDFQDVHLVLTGLSAEKPITQIIVTGYGGGDWRLVGAPAAYALALVRHGTTADLYLQPYQNETGRYITVEIHFADGTTVYPIVDALYATARLPMPIDPAPATSVVSARGGNAAGGEGPAQAFDGDVHTKWLDFSATSWIQYQFAGGAAPVISQYTITSANDTALYPGRAPNSWTLKGSNDGVTWTTLDVRTNEAVTSNFTATTYTFANSTPFKIYKLDDIVSNGDPIIQIAEIQFQTTPTAAAVVDLARGKAATSSSNEGAAYAPGNTVDGDASTRWSSGQWLQNNNIGWITIDLGAVFDVDRVTLDWEAAFAVDYQIQVSDDASNWTTVQSVVGNTTSGVIDYTNLSARGRYVRIYCTQVNATKNYSLYDVNVYGA
ncbi:discoidin domain-containing protein [Paludisphaera borealis]|uniref:F5/8 type C domain-containing protein n=1 Tax=Paludisphaera borealis TaxID=1387353 RepID=A0A1U7CSK8_9BACT|nr:discoidin domain-containing protein [Paludisphaera borealis]APW61930.1 hypothetical protein BSF38_03462 [Paludisphaera borealis]